LLYVTILVTLVILSSFIVVHSYAQEAEVKHLLRVSSSPNIIFIPGGGSYSAGTSVTLEAPESWRDYRFEGWEINGRWSSENPLIIVMNRNYNIDAVYTKTESVGEIIVDSIPRVTEITVDDTIYLPSELPLSFDWETGSDHTLIISHIVNETPDTRYKFDSWKDRSRETFRSITAARTILFTIAGVRSSFHSAITVFGLFIMTLPFDASVFPRIKFVTRIRSLIYDM